MTCLVSMTLNECLVMQSPRSWLKIIFGGVVYTRRSKGTWIFDFINTQPKALNLTNRQLKYFPVYKGLVYWVNLKFINIRIFSETTFKENMEIIDNYVEAFLTLFSIHPAFAVYLGKLSVFLVFSGPCTFRK